MAPELKLGVGLDLAYFRQQMRKAVNIAQSEFTAQLNVKINRQKIQDEIRNLDRALKRKKFSIELNIAGGLDRRKFEEIQKRLDALGARENVEIPISVKNGVTRAEAQSTVSSIKTRILSTQTISQGDGKLRIPVSIKSSITRADVTQFKRDVRSKLDGITVKVKAEVEGVSRGAAFAAGPSGFAGLQEFMRTQGMSGGNMPSQTPVGMGRRARFEKAVEEATVKQLEQMLRTAEVAGRSKLKTKSAMQAKLLELDDIAMESILGNLKMQMQQPRKIKRSFLDQIARAVMYMAGVDPEVLRQQAAARRLPPAIDFPATVPTRSVSIGPSPTGRALSGVTQESLPGTSRFAAKYLPSGLGDELKRILRGAAYAFVDSLNQRVRQVSVREIGQAQLAPSKVAGLLPSAVGRPSATYGGPGDVVSRRIAQARRRSAERSARIMAEGPQGFALGAGGSGPAGPFRPFAQPSRGGAIVPYNAAMAGGPSTQLSPGYFTGGKIQQALKGADQYLKQSRVPLTGAIQELGSEFGNAVKQVLLFGTAYKALAFIINLPNQALAAATSLQTFNNQLLAVTGSAGAASQAFSFIDGLAERFNVPLESARQGFVRLYASMEPAGFAPEQIEGLFTGISKAAATFGLSADQVDRVTYAFSQMASKGQAMSEELKGQLGDVLPGSLALFARAAQMSIPEFTKALEDGAFKGEAFQALLRNVAKLMNTEFAGGAAGAADTLQGRMNDLSNSVTKMYESFEPLVDLISAQVFPQLSGIIGDATEAIQAFVAGIQGAEDPAAQLSSRGLAIYEALRQVADVGQSLQGIISALAPTFGVLANVVLSVVQGISQLLNTGAGQWLAKLAVQTALAAAALQLMAKAGLGAAIRGLVLFVTNKKGAIVALKTLIATSRIAKVALGGLVIGTVLVFWEAMASKIDDTSKKLRDVAKDIRILSNELDALAQAADVASITAKLTPLQEESESLKKSRTVLEEASRAGLKGRVTTPEEFARLERAGLTRGLRLIERGGETRLFAQAGAVDKNLKRLQDRLQKVAFEAGEVQDSLEHALDVRSKQIDENLKLEQVELETKTDAGKGKGLESYYNLEDSLAKAQSEADIDRIEALHNHRINMINAVYDLQEARANSHQKEAIRFERELMNAELKRQSAVLKASLDVRKARESVAGGAIAGPGGSGSIVERLTGDPSSPYYRADHGGANYHEHLAFATKVQRDAAMKALEAQGIKIGSVNDGRHAPGSYHYSDQAFDVPGSQVPVGQEAELSRRVMSILADAGFTGGGITADTGGAGGARKISSSERRESLADMKTSLAIAKESIVVKQAEGLAAKETAIALEKYAASIAPVEETKLQNKLLEERGKLVRAGVSQEDIDMRIQLYETEQRVALGIAAINKLRTEGIYGDEKAQDMINRLQQAYEGLNAALAKNNELQKQSKFDTARIGLQNRLSMARAITPGQEIRERFRQEDFAPEKVEQLAQLEELAIKAEEIKAIYQNVAQTIGSAFGQAFQDVVNGSKGMQEALSDMLQSIGESFVAMAAEIIAKQVAMITLQAILKALGGPSFSGGGGGGGLPVSGGNVSSFNTTGFGSLSPQAFPVIGSANGNVLRGGFQAFANGGVVKGPTLGLVGEGRYNEAVVPLPDGRSIPVQMQGTSSSRQLLSEREARQNNSPSVLSMSFETTNINGVEYVSRDQLEQAMASTRKAAARDGAAQGSRLTLDKLRNSPTTRRQIGIS